MTYRITLASNPRLVFLFLIIVALPGLGVAAFFFWTPVAGVIVALIGSFFAYNFLKLVRSILSSRIETKASGISFDFGKGHVDEFAWDAITHAGEYPDEHGKQSFFVYNEDEDQLITVPSEYAEFDKLILEVKAGVGERFETIEIGTAATINEYLKARFAPDEVDEEEYDESEEEELSEEALSEDEPSDDE